MFCIAKKLLRFGVVAGVLTGAAIGGTALFAGTDRVEILLDKVQTGVIETIDQAIDDPAAMRAQLRDLADEYPERIAAVRGDLAELNQQIAALQHEHEVATRVVALAERDLGELEPSLEQAMHLGRENGNRLTSAVEFENRLLTVGQASNRVNQIKQTRATYVNRAADAQHDLIYLNQQAERLEEMLSKLQNEQASFQGQLAQLERQVDAIARNERLIKMMEERQETIEECSRYEPAAWTTSSPAWPRCAAARRPSWTSSPVKSRPTTTRPSPRWS